MQPPPPFKALYLTSTGDIEIRTVPEIYQPAGSQLLIQVHHSAIQPGDLRHFYMGMHSFVMGYDYAGTVLSSSSPPASPSPSRFQPGDQVLGMTKPGHARPEHAGAHQAYLLADPDESLIWRRPEGLNPLAAARFTSATLTAADILFNIFGFGFSPAGVEGPDPKGKAVLIWGAAGSVGWATLQLAREAGFSPILVTASAGNHEGLRRGGATHCFDYRDGNVVGDIRAVLEEAGFELGVILDAVGVGLGFAEPAETEKRPYELSSAAQAKRCLSDAVLSRGEAKLACVLPVLQDPDWVFALYSRKHDAEQLREHPGWWPRQEKAVTWLVENHATAWRELAGQRVVGNAVDAVAAVWDVFEGRVGAEKILIEHPME